jgi:hypothetical protein
MEALVEKHEQIQEALEHERIGGKVAEQMNQTLKGILKVAQLEMQYWALGMKYKRGIPVPRSPILRSIVGLSAEASPTDGEHLRAVIGDK